jgi:hypothetical protein
VAKFIIKCIKVDQITHFPIFRDRPVMPLSCPVCSFFLSFPNIPPALHALPPRHHVHCRHKHRHKQTCTDCTTPTAMHITRAFSPTDATAPFFSIPPLLAFFSSTNHSREASAKRVSLCDRAAKPYEAINRPAYIGWRTYAYIPLVTKACLARGTARGLMFLPRDTRA